jgi:hypothetical protein
VVIGYRHAGDSRKAAIELFPVTGKRQAAAASQSGLATSSIPTLLVEGDNRAGLGHAIAQAIADAGVNLTFLVAQVIGRRYSAVIGFDNEADAKKASALIKKASPAKKK